MSEKTYTAAEMANMMRYLSATPQSQMITDGVIDMDVLHRKTHRYVRVVLIKTGDRRIQAIKAIRQHLGWDLMEAKQATEPGSTATVLVTTSDHALAEALASDLAAIGVDVAVEGAE